MGELVVQSSASNRAQLSELSCAVGKVLCAKYNLLPKETDAVTFETPKLELHNLSLKFMRSYVKERSHKCSTSSRTYRIRNCRGLVEGIDSFRYREPLAIDTLALSL